MFPTLQAEKKVENEEVKEQNTQELGFPDLSFPTLGEIPNEQVNEEKIIVIENETKDVSEEEGLSETELRFSDKDNKYLVVLKTEKVLNIKINPRINLNEKNIEDMLEVNSEDIVPINLGYFENDVIYNEMNLKGKMVLVDGEHRLESRIRGEHEFIKTNIVKYNSMKELKKDAFTMNITHGMRLSGEEIQRRIYEIASEEKEKTPRQLAREYNMDRGAWERICVRIKLEDVAKKVNNTALLALLQRIPTTLMRPLTKLSQDSDIRIINFFTNFEPLFNTIMRQDLMERVKECVNLYREDKIATYSEFLDLKEDESKTKDEKGFFEMLESPAIITNTEDKDAEKEEMIEKYLNKAKEKPVFSIHSFTKNLFEDSRAKLESLKEIFGNKNYDIEFNDDIGNSALEDIRKVREKMDEAEKLILDKMQKGE